MRDGWNGPDLSGDEVCHGYRDCLVLIEEGQFDRAEAFIADLWTVDPRYARALGDRLEVARRWQSAQSNEAERRRFWEWMDSRR
ncbi:MAG: hypothetical protein Q7O66_05305 [Dehalococcoidia bacterium]|nr:hypothetical protein [Dehalococcoidia bacterium]